MLNADENRKIWMKAAEDNRELLEGRVKTDIEKHRKGWCKLRFSDSDGKPLKGKKVRVCQKTHDFGFGANIFMLDEFDSAEYNRIYREEFKKYFNLATVPFYWSGLEPEEGKLRYAKDSPKIYRRPAPELCVEYCEENGIRPKLHCLVYEYFLPEWAPKKDMRKMEWLYEKRFSEIAERYSGRMAEFEVINEVTTHLGNPVKSIISDKRDLVEWAFETARKYFPNEKLVINEAQPLQKLACEGYRHRYFMLLENALKSGACIDKIGLQNHLFIGSGAPNEEVYEAAVKNGADDTVNPQKILKGLDIISEFGLPLEMTEVTVPTFGDTPEDEELQADILEMLYSVWFSHPNMEDIVYWNLPDGCAYGGENKCRGGLLHKDLTPKKSAERLYRLVNEVWHTDTELTTDENGYVEFRGFYGDYTAETNGFAADFAIHKNECNVTEIML